MSPIKHEATSHWSCICTWIKPCLKVVLLALRPVSIGLLILATKRLPGDIRCVVITIPCCRNSQQRASPFGGQESLLRKGHLRLNLKDEWGFLGRSLSDWDNIAMVLGRPSVAWPTERERGLERRTGAPEPPHKGLQKGQRVRILFFRH